MQPELMLLDPGLKPVGAAELAASLHDPAPQLVWLTHDVVRRCLAADDPQLDRAIAEVFAGLEDRPAAHAAASRVRPPRVPDPDAAAPGVGAADQTCCAA